MMVPSGNGRGPKLGCKQLQLSPGRKVPTFFELVVIHEFEKEKGGQTRQFMIEGQKPKRDKPCDPTSCPPDFKTLLRTVTSAGLDETPALEAGG